MQQLSEGAYRSADQVEGEERIAGQGKGEEPMQGLNFGGDIEILYSRGELERLQAYGSVIMKRKMEGEIS